MSWYFIFAWRDYIASYEYSLTWSLVGIIQGNILISSPVLIVLRNSLIDKLLILKDNVSLNASIQFLRELTKTNYKD